jgi:hypothetical protein
MMDNETLQLIIGHFKELRNDMNSCQKEVEIAVQCGLVVQC